MLSEIKISAFSFSNNPNSMNTKGLFMMNDYINFYVCKSMSDYNMKLLDTNDVDGKVDKGIKVLEIAPDITKQELINSTEADLVFS